jgi:hypothetical protein
MEIFWRLILAHFIADFSLQTNRIAQWKRSSEWGMLVHILTHPVVSVVLVWPYLSQPWVQTPWFSINGWVAVSLIAVLHYLEDEWRVWSIQHTGSPDSTGFFLWDQVVHYTVILALSPTAITSPTPDWVMVALCFVMLAHFTSVLIYFIENDLWGKSNVLEGKKYNFMTERIVGAALFLLPGMWMLLAVLWLAWMAYKQLSLSEERTWVHRLIGTAGTILLGLTARGFLY